MESEPLLVVLAGPNGSGKTTLVETRLQPITHLPFVNADIIAAERWPGDEVEHAYDASQLAAQERARLIGLRRSFITETVFSHPSKLELITEAVSRGYRVDLHVVLLPEDVALARVAHRVARGGHDVPEQKVRERFRRLWPLVAQARDLADTTVFYDNSTAKAALRVVARYERGRLLGEARWPAWTPPALLASG